MHGRWWQFWKPLSLVWTWNSPKQDGDYSWSKFIIHSKYAHQMTHIRNVRIEWGSHRSSYPLFVFGIISWSYTSLHRNYSAYPARATLARRSATPHPPARLFPVISRAQHTCTCSVAALLHFGMLTLRHFACLARNALQYCSEALGSQVEHDRMFVPDGHTRGSKCICSVFEKTSYCSDLYNQLPAVNFLLALHNGCMDVDQQILAGTTYDIFSICCVLEDFKCCKKLYWKNSRSQLDFAPTYICISVRRKVILLPDGGSLLTSLLK